MDDPSVWLCEWPRESLKRWLIGLGTLALFMLVLYMLFSWIGW